MLSMLLKRRHELTQRLEAASEGCRHPAVEELLGGLGIDILPKLLKLILQHPGPVNTRIARLLAGEQPGMPLGPVC